MTTTHERPPSGAEGGPQRALRPGLVAVLVVAPLAAALATLALLGAGRGDRRDRATEPASRFAGVELTQPAPKPDFVLTDTSGRPFDFRAETEGKLTLLYFGYTRCPDVCPVHLAQIASVLRDRPELNDDAVTVVFVSVDPERDTPAVIRQWLDNFDSRFIGLTGTAEQLAAAQQAAGAAPAAREPGSGGDYTVGHAAQVFAYAPDGLGYTVYPFGTRQSQWAHDLPLLAAIGPRPSPDRPASETTTR